MSATILNSLTPCDSIIKSTKVTTTTSPQQIDPVTMLTTLALYRAAFIFSIALVTSPRSELSESYVLA